MSTPQANEGTSVSAENLRGMHLAEIIAFTRDTDGPGAPGVFYNSLGLTDDVSDEEFGAQFRALEVPKPAASRHTSSSTSTRTTTSASTMPGPLTGPADSVSTPRRKTMTHSAKLPNDDADATLMRFDAVREQRYTEIFLIAPAETGELIGSIYNTIGLNDPDGSGDTCPQPLLDQLDMPALAQEYGTPAAFKNGPRLWCLDWIEIMVGAERDFHGLKARWVMWLDVPKGMGGPQEELAYKPITGKRDTQFGINKGSPAFILDDPDGNTWVMKSVSLIIDPHQTYAAMPQLGERLQLPAGWSFRAVTLEQDLVLTPENGTARILQDDVGNTYDRVGGPFSNYKP